MVIKSGGKNAYFAASNSVSGFFSYYDEIFNAARIEYVYAIKGGPGTGKSRFLREVAARAECEGRVVEYVYCSSDPYSLDAVIITGGRRGGIALLDATAPHVYEPTCPGAREEIINLGAFWDAERLIERREEIERLNRDKREAYRRAYRYLAGLGEMNATRDSLVAPFVKRERIRVLADRLMQGVGEGSAFSSVPALMHSVGMRGEVGFDTYFADAARIYVIEDCRGASQYLMSELGERARDLRLRIRVSHDPVEPEKIDGLFLCESGIAFAVCAPKLCDFPHKRISMRRMVDVCALKSVKHDLNHAERMRRAMRQGALESMERVREVHFRIEEIYMAAMDFDTKEKYTKSFCDRLFDLQTE